MGNGIEISKFQKVQQMVRDGGSKRAVLARHHISERTFKRIMSVRSFAAYQRATVERNEAERDRRAKARKSAAKEFNKPMRGTSPATMDQDYKASDPAKVEKVKAALGDEPMPTTKKPWWRFW